MPELPSTVWNVEIHGNDFAVAIAVIDGSTSSKALANSAIEIDESNSNATTGKLTSMK